MNKKMYYHSPEVFWSNLAADSIFCDTFSALLDPYEYDDEFEW